MRDKFYYLFLYGGLFNVFFGLLAMNRKAPVPKELKGKPSAKRYMIAQGLRGVVLGIWAVILRRLYLTGIVNTSIMTTAFVLVLCLLGKIVRDYQKKIYNIEISPEK